MKAIISNISGKDRVVVQGKGWVPISEVVVTDKVKAADGFFYLVTEINFSPKTGQQ